MSYSVKVGKRTVDVEYASSGVPVLSLTGRGGGSARVTAADGSPGAIAAAAQQVVAAVAAAEQVTIDRARAIEDAQRILGH